MTASRRLAFEYLIADPSRGPHVADWLALPEPSRLAPRDAGFLRELLFGVLRRRGEVDAVLAPLSRRALEDLHPTVLAALRLGAYQLLHMRVPAHAAVGESVDLVRSRAAHTAPFVNAVLRRLAREGPAPGPDPEGAPREWLISRGSLPAWLAERWLGALGPTRAVARAKAMLEVPEAYVRLNPRVPDARERCDAAGLVLSPALVPGALRVETGQPRKLMEDGVLHIQDQASQAVAHLACGPGRLHLDACAAPGGKTLLLADLTSNEARVIAAEISDRRLDSLRRIVGRWGARNVRLVRASLENPPFGTESFDSVLVDAPCSGLGTLARNPDIRWRLDERAIAVSARRQARLISQAARLVRTGGRLVYSVCSLEPEETGDVVSGFLAQHPDWEPVAPPPWAQEHRAGLGVEFTPEALAGDGFFAVVLRKACGTLDS